MRPRAVLPHVTAVAALTLLAGCSAPITVPVGPDAADPVCAEVVLALPERLGDLPRLESGTQAAAVWGDRVDPVVLRCGVTPLGPTTDQCVQADDGSISVDWIAVPPEETADGDHWLFTTYGRVPAVEVRVPTSVTQTSSTSFLLDLGRAVDRAEVESTCL